MCGQFALGSGFDWGGFCIRLDIRDLVDSKDKLRFSEVFKPSQKIPIVTQQGAGHQLCQATWSLLLEETDGGFKPHAKYATFNSKSSRLTESPVSKKAFKRSRCIIPASSFVEGDGPKGHRYYHQLTPESGMIAFGGLYREWIHSKTGELMYSASIITLLGHPKLKDVHQKSMPLMLPLDQPALAHDWLNSSLQATERFNDLLVPTLFDSFEILPIDRPGNKLPIGERYKIERD